MNLWDGLRLERNSRVAFVGAGGKTSAIFACARDYANPILITTTTHLAVGEADLADFAYEVNSPEDVSRIFSKPIKGIVLFYGISKVQDRLGGLPGETLQCLKKYADDLDFPLLIEADGSRGVPLKAPYAHEPPIPKWVNHVVVVCGLSGIGKPASSETIYHMDAFLEMGKIEAGELIAPVHVVDVLLNNRGGRKNVPDGVKTSVFLNQWDTRVENIVEFSENWQPLLKKYDQVLIGNAGNKTTPPAVFARIEKTAGIILAAGNSSRLGKPKRHD